MGKLLGENGYPNLRARTLRRRNGLYLVVSPAGSKSWIQRVQIGGKRTDRGLGGVAKVSLSNARKIAAATLGDSERQESI